MEHTKQFRELGIGEHFRFTAAAGGPFEKTGRTTYRPAGTMETRKVGSVTVRVDVVPMDPPRTFGALAVGDVFRFVGSHPTPGVSRLGPYRKTGTGSTFRPDDEPANDDGSQVDVCTDKGRAVERIAGAPAWAERVALFVELDAGTSGNGKGRRGFLFLSRGGDVVACVDAYAGRADWMRRAVRAGRMGEGPRIRTTAGELRDFLRMSDESDR